MFNNKATIAVLGPTQDPLKPDVGQLARDLGYTLGDAGYTIVTLGNQGVSEHAIQGAVRANGATVQVLATGETAVEASQSTAIEAPSSFGRLEAVLKIADGVMVLPGDLEALAIVLQIWSYGLTRQGPYRQVVLTGPGWSEIVTNLASAAGLDARERAMLTFAENAASGVESLRYFVPPA